MPIIANVLDKDCFSISAGSTGGGESADSAHAVFYLMFSGTDPVAESITVKVDLTELDKFFADYEINPFEPVFVEIQVYSGVTVSMGLIFYRGPNDTMGECLVFRAIKKGVREVRKYAYFTPMATYRIKEAVLSHLRKERS